MSRSTWADGGGEGGGGPVKLRFHHQASFQGAKDFMDRERDLGQTNKTRSLKIGQDRLSANPDSTFFFCEAATRDWYRTQTELHNGQEIEACVRVLVGNLPEFTLASSDTSNTQRLKHLVMEECLKLTLVMRRQMGKFSWTACWTTFSVVTMTPSTASTTSNTPSESRIAALTSSKKLICPAGARTNLTCRSILKIRGQRVHRVRGISTVWKVPRESA